MNRSIGIKEPKTENNLGEIEVTEEEYNDQIARGFDKEELLSPGKHKFSRVSPDGPSSKTG